jgi:hypothetical protein
MAIGTTLEKWAKLYKIDVTDQDNKACDDAIA